MNTHGVTKDGQPVHVKTADHRKGGINKKIGLAITNHVGTMVTAYVFFFLSLLALPAVLSQAFPHLAIFPHWLISASLIDLVAWISSYFLQLFLLPVIIVGQNAQAEASDVRAAKGFEDTEKMLDMLDLTTAGGMTVILNAIQELKEGSSK